MESKEKISVIISTKGRPEHLARCLSSIFASHRNYPYDELIVIDATPDKDVARENSETAKNFGASYSLLPTVSHSAALNIAIKQAQGDILIMIDDDCIIDEYAVRNLVANFRDPKVMACGGRVLPYFQDDISTLEERYHHAEQEQKCRVSPKEANLMRFIKMVLIRLLCPRKAFAGDRAWPGTFGLFRFRAFRRDTFTIAGLFDESLGPGTPAYSCEDTDMNCRMLKANCEYIYEPSAIAYHFHRQTMDALLSQYYGRGVGARAFAQKHKKEFYLTVTVFGSFCLTFLSMLKCHLTSDPLRKLKAAYVKGFLSRPKN